MNELDKLRIYFMRIRLLFFFVLLASVVQAQEVDVLHYRFDLELQDKHDTISGHASIRFVHKTDAKEVTLDLVGSQPEGRGMKVLWAKVEGQAEAIGLAVKQGQDKVYVTLPSARKGDTITLQLHYKGIPTDGLVISKNKFGDRTFFSDNWPNRAHHWIPCNDRPGDKASFEFLVKAPAHYAVISNGVKVSEQLMDGSKKQTHWREDIPQATKVMVIGVARFAIKTFADSPVGIPVSAWVYPQDSTRGFYDYGLAPGILKFFADYIGPFPYRKLANVQSTTIFGGMENASAIFYAEHSVTGQRDSEDLLAHEIAHQWFGDAVTEKSFAHLWLSEGFANYMTILYFEKKHGRNTAVERLQEERKEVVRFATESNRPVVDSTENLMSLLNANSYQKGAWVLHMLRNEVGDTAFQRIVQTYYQQYKGSNAGTRDFEALAEKVSGKELTAFFDQWLYRPGVPLVAAKLYQDKEQVVLTVSQEQPLPFSFPLEILLEGEDGKKLVVNERITLDKQLFRYRPGFAVKKLTLDPNCKLLFEDRTRK